LFRNCWYIDVFKSGRYYFNRTKNLNAQLNSYVKTCSDEDREVVIDSKLKEMFEPREKRCYQKLYIHEDLTKVNLERDKTTLLICGHEASYTQYFTDAKYKNRVAILTLVDPAGLVRVRNHARRQWAINQVIRDMSKDDGQYEKAIEERTNIQSELFLALRSVYAKLLYPLGDPSTGDSKLAEATLLDSYVEEGSEKFIKYDGKDNASKGELVIEATLKENRKFHVVKAATGTDKAKSFQALRARVEQFLFPNSGRASWDQITDSAASRGLMVWTEPGLIDRMKDVLVTAGEWREEAGQLLKPPFEELTAVSIEYNRDPKTGRICTTDIKLHHGDTLLVSEDGSEFKRVKANEAFCSNAMVLVFQAEDSTGKNKTGRPYRIENRIDLKHDFMPSAISGYQTLKIGVVPTDSNLKWTADGTDPANNGKPYSSIGVEVANGANVKIFAEKGALHKEISIIVPMMDGIDGDKATTASLDLEKPAILTGKALKEFGLVTRKGVHAFLSDLPAGTVITGPRAKVIKTESDNRVAISWDSKLKLTEEQLLRAFEFLDVELADAEWELEASSIVFPTGKAIVQWQAKQSKKISPTLITQ
jgi:hypothetical protein